ncbi:MAG: hypothetical protein KF716_34385 [Anaerolineae bacterium]|nr:hypothetical protein [Anaerolineae bacterium]
MRRLLTWIAISMACASLLLVGVRAIHSDSPPTACVQLLSPTTGDVLTVDANTGAALLDARKDFPLPVAYPLYRSNISPDQRYIIRGVNVSFKGIDFIRAWIGRRSTTNSHNLTGATLATQFVWSPDSKYVAFTGARGWGTRSILLDFAIMNVDNQTLHREEIPEALDNLWFSSSQDIVWSPDSSTAAVAFHELNVGATLALRPADADQSIRIPFRKETISYLMWSPNSQYVYVFTQDDPTTFRKLYVVQRDGHILRQLALPTDLEPMFVDYTISAPRYRWSRDGQYFYLYRSMMNKPRVDVFNLSGKQVTTSSLPVSPQFTSTLWSAQPHTLLYIHADIDAAYQSLVALDVETQQITTLLSAVPYNYRVWLSPNSLEFIVSERINTNRSIPHLFSLDLTKHETPFGEILIKLANGSESNEPIPNWSPSNQKVMLVSEDDTKFRLVWWNKTTRELKHLDFSKQEYVGWGVSPKWLSDDLLGIDTLSTKVNGRKALLLDEPSMTLTTLLSASSDSPYYFAKINDDLVVIATSTNAILYRLTTGSTATVKLPNSLGEIGLIVEPHQRASVLLNGRDANFGRASLSLITTTSTMLLVDADYIAQPVWSSDGEIFTFAFANTASASPMLQIMSRDGILLHSFSLPPRTSLTDYSQLRWTTCQ